jgi:hypothetical protein
MTPKARKCLQSLRDFEVLDFTGKGEAYVEQAFLTPLLRLLGERMVRDAQVLPTLT